MEPSTYYREIILIKKSHLIVVFEQNLSETSTCVQCTNCKCCLCITVLDCIHYCTWCLLLCVCHCEHVQVWSNSKHIKHDTWSTHEHHSTTIHSKHSLCQSICKSIFTVCDHCGCCCCNIAFTVWGTSVAKPCTVVTRTK